MAAYFIDVIPAWASMPADIRGAVKNVLVKKY